MNSESALSARLGTSALNRQVNEDAFIVNIPVQTLLHVIEGTSAATLADEKIVESFITWITLFSKDLSDNDKRNACEESGGDITANQWLTDIDSTFKNDRELLLFARFNLAVAVWHEVSRSGNNYTSAQLQQIWLLIFDAITGTKGNRFRFTAARSAQGFLAVPLCSRLINGRIDQLFRFHVWLPDGERGLAEVAIHAHQPFARSWILAGFGENSMYDVHLVDDFPSATHSVYVPQWSDGSQAGKAYKTHQVSSTVVNTGKYVRVTPGTKNNHFRDMSYDVPSGVCHRSMVPKHKLHATLFLFDAHGGFVEDAMVVGPKSGREYTQIRDPAGITPFTLAQLTNATRSWEQRHSIRDSDHYEHRTIMAYYDYFMGHNAMSAGQHEKALQFFDHKTSSAIHAFCRDPSRTHRQYVRALIDAGADLDIVDDEGYKPLDYAVYNQDEETKDLIIQGLRKQLQGEIEPKIERRKFEAVVRKAYRDLFEKRLRPLLQTGDRNTLQRMREVYATAIATDPFYRRIFDGLRYIPYPAFLASGRLPRYADGTLHTHKPMSDPRAKDNAEHIVFVSYRWIRKDPNTGKTAPDDLNHTQYRLMLEALEQYLSQHPHVDPKKFGIWMDSASINRKDPWPGISALPMTLSQCDALISIADDIYWTRSWCSVEVLMIQTLCRHYNYHEWFVFSPVNGSGSTSGTTKIEAISSGAQVGSRELESKWNFSSGPLDLEIDMAVKAMTWEADRDVTRFLERQARLLAVRPRDAKAASSSKTRASKL